ncbi:MAG: hypothetical protein HYV07_15185 [Deltaproteobacteria bacterium]|nr:hypothetical protein [Deltaproteobacteria bacterium]
MRVRWILAGILTSGVVRAGEPDYAALSARASLVTSADLKAIVDGVVNACSGRLASSERELCNVRARGDFKALSARLFRATASAELGTYELEKRRFPVYLFAELGRAASLESLPSWTFADRTPPVLKDYYSVPDLEQARRARVQSELKAEIIFRFASSLKSIRDDGRVVVEILGAQVVDQEGRSVLSAP